MPHRLAVFVIVHSPAANKIVQSSVMVKLVLNLMSYQKQIFTPDDTIANTCQRLADTVLLSGKTVIHAAFYIPAIILYNIIQRMRP